MNIIFTHLVFLVVSTVKDEKMMQIVKGRGELHVLSSFLQHIINKKKLPVTSTESQKNCKTKICKLFK